MARGLVAIGLLLLVAGLVLPPVAAGSASTTVVDRSVDAGAVPPASTQPVAGFESASDATTSGLFAVERSDFDQTVFSIEVYENASARWTFQYTRNLVNDTERESFESFARDFNQNETLLYTNFVEQATALTRAGTNATGRQMDASAFSRSASVTPLGNRGIVELSFTWSRFGVQEGDRVIVSDVFEGGLYVRSDQRLQFVAGPGLAFEDVEPLPSNTSGESLAERESISWLGERTFSDRRPFVAFQPASAVTTSTETDPTTDESTTTTGPGTDTTTEDTDQTTTVAAGGSSNGAGLLLIVVALGLIALGIGVAAWINGYFDTDGDGEASDTDGPDEPPSPGGAAESTSPSAESPELLTDDDRVIQLLEAQGGRMKQTEIVDATDWSKSKVSMLLSDMEDDDQITKLRVGRENIISLPGAEPEAARSPFEDVDE